MTAFADRWAASWRHDLAQLAAHAGADRHDAELHYLCRQWSQPHRRYHTLQHLDEMLTAIEALAPPALDADRARPVRLAAWYHDVHYDVRAAPGSSEQRSATIARDHLHRLGVEDTVVNEIESLILGTADHQGATTPASPRWDVMHDADLWILSAPPERYQQYATQVRQEYAHVGADDFARGRAAIMTALVEPSWIYRTEYARDRWEAAARSNVTAEIAALS